MGGRLRLALQTSSSVTETCRKDSDCEMCNDLRVEHAQDKVKNDQAISESQRVVIKRGVNAKVGERRSFGR